MKFIKSSLTVASGQNMSSWSIITRPKPKKSIPCWDSHQHPLTHMFVTVFACKWCLICAYSSPDWAEITYFTGESNIVNKGVTSNKVKKKKNMLMMDLFLTEMFLNPQDVNWWTGVLWFTCGLLWCFISYLDSHSDGTHSLQMIHWWTSNVMFLQIWWRNNLIYCTSWVASVHVNLSECNGLQFELLCLIFINCIFFEQLIDNNSLRHPGDPKIKI